MGPIDYFSQLNMPNLTQSFGQGLQVGAAMDAIQQQRLERQRAEEARIAQQEFARQNALDIQEAIRTRSPAAFAKVVANNPQHREAFKDMWSMMDKDKQDSLFLSGSQAINAVNAGKPQVALDMLEQEIEAARNSGQDTRQLESLRDSFKAKPEETVASIGMFLYGVDPERAEKYMKGQEVAATTGATIRKAEAQASEAQSQAAIRATEARNKQRQIDLENEFKRVQMANMQAEAQDRRERTRIAAMEAALKREDNALKRQELSLKLEQARSEQDGRIRTRVAEADAARGNIDNALNTMDRILSADPDVLEDVLGPIDSMTPTLGAEEADLEALIETLESQAFLSQVPQMAGMGGLSNAEGQKLASALQSFSRKQTPTQLKANLKAAQTLLLKARRNVEVKYGVESNIPDRPNVATQTQGQSAPGQFKIIRKVSE